jgi:hypothetical protein
MQDRRQGLRPCRDGAVKRCWIAAACCTATQRLGVGAVRAAQRIYRSRPGKSTVCTWAGCSQMTPEPFAERASIKLLAQNPFWES